MITTSYSSEQGKKARNEDAWGAWRLFSPRREVFLLAVADGVGSQPAGSVASWTAIEALRNSVGAACEVAPDLSQLSARRILAAGFMSANQAVLREASLVGEWRGMATTLVAALLCGDGSLVVGWVGDSRAYLLADGMTRCLTRDHVVSTSDSPFFSSNRSPDLSRVIGRPCATVDIFGGVVPCGRLLLCSDGLSRAVPDEVISVRIMEGRLSFTCNEMVALAARKGDDDVTAVMAEWDGRMDDKLLGEGLAPKSAWGMNTQIRILD